MQNTMEVRRKRMAKKRANRRKNAQAGKQRAENRGVPAKVVRELQAKQKTELALVRAFAAAMARQSA